jgi:hypothetical protein
VNLSGYAIYTVSRTLTPFFASLEYGLGILPVLEPGTGHNDDALLLQHNTTISYEQELN